MTDLGGTPDAAEETATTGRLGRRRGRGPSPRRRHPAGQGLPAVERPRPAPRTVRGDRYLRPERPASGDPRRRAEPRIDLKGRGPASYFFPSTFPLTSTGAVPSSLP